MAEDSKVNHEELAVELNTLLYAEDVVGAKRLFVGIDEQDKKKIVAEAGKSRIYYEPLCFAAETGNIDMIEFLVKDCQANIEHSRYSRFRTPLWLAAAKNRFDVVKLLQELGADINARSMDGTTSVKYACLKRQMETVEFLVGRGANINSPDERDETCLMNSVHSLELCQFLIDTGARVNEKDELGNTALHHAIEKGNLEIVQFLLDHGSDQNIENKLGDDALQFASLCGKEMFVTELVARRKPSASRWIESLQLLGNYFFFSEAADRVEKALIFWKRSVELRMMNPSAELRKNESTPVFMIASEVKTVEELEDLCQDQEMVHIYAIENHLRILGSSHKETVNGLAIVCKGLDRIRKYRRSFDLLKYVFQQLQQKCTLTKEYLSVLRMLCRACSDEEEQFHLEFNDVIEILDMLTLKAQFVSTLKKNPYEALNISQFMTMILDFVLFMFKLDKSPDQVVRFKRTVRRLVHIQLRNWYGRTFLHHAVVECRPSVVELLLECGADANSVDSQHNTALHLRARGLTAFDLQTKMDAVINILLRYSAHPDIVNDQGDFAASGMSLHILDNVNLKCLATAVIRDRQIPYEGQIPESLESFVRMHGGCPSMNSRFDYPFIALRIASESSKCDNNTPFL